MTEYKIYRKIVAQNISLCKAEGGWEGSHLDFKLMLHDNINTISKIIKHILAFANTPRKREAFIIFGVREVKDLKSFIHEGADIFPEADKIYNYLFSNINFEPNDILIDDRFIFNNKRTPYIVIQQVFNGPYYSKKTIHNVQKKVIYTRYGRSSIEAAKRDQERMKDWATWSIDLRYVTNKNILVDELKKYFDNIDKIEIKKDYVRFIYGQEYSDDFGIYTKKFLVHAYDGVHPIENIAVNDMLEDDYPNCDKCIIGPQFALDLIDSAKVNNIRLIDMDKVFFKNDPYAKYCKSFLKYWKKNCESLQITKVIDLDYKTEGNRKKSIISFLDKEIKHNEVFSTIVIGDFGTGKSVTAKYLTSEIAKDYLRKASDFKKVIFINLNNYDLRTKVENILRYELEVNCRLNSEDVDKLISLYEKDEISIIFDSVDEMAKPYSKEGRKQVMEALRKIGNRASSIYFVRSTYFKSKNELQDMFKRLSFNVKTSSYSLNIVEICDLEEIQIKELFFSRIDKEIVSKILSLISKKDYKMILRDPLIVSMICNYIDDILSQSSDNNDTHNIITQFFNESPTTGRISFLSYLLSGLLQREHIKRKQHKATEFYDIFIGFLNEIAYLMICEGTNYIPINRWNKLIEQNIIKGMDDFENEAIDAFRTMAWVKRDDKQNTVFFRNELLSLICASKFIITALTTIKTDHYRRRLLEEWNKDSENADNVISYAASLLKNEDIVKIALELEKNPTAKIKMLIVDILKRIDGLSNNKVNKIDMNESNLIGALGNCIVDFPETGSILLPLIENNISVSRFSSLLFPLLVKINDRYYENRNELLVNASIYLINSMHKATIDWNVKNMIGSQLQYIKRNSNIYFDKLLLKKIGITQKSILSPSHYKEIYGATRDRKDLNEYELRYIDRSYKWIERETSGDLYRVK